MTLTRRSGEYVILANGKSLMSSRMHGSEEALATLACRRARTLEAAVRARRRSRHGLHAARDARSAPAGRDRRRRRAAAGGRGVEPRPARAAGRTPAEGSGACASRWATSRRRCARAAGRFDAVLLDVDNGPAAFTALGQRRRSTTIAGWPPPARRSRPAACWPSGRPGRIGSSSSACVMAGSPSRSARVRGRLKKGGPRHTIFLGHNRAA